MPKILEICTIILVLLLYNSKININIIILVQVLEP